MRRRNHMPYHLVWGIVLVTVGTLFIFHNTGLLNAFGILRFWPVLFIVFGALRLANGRDQSSILIGGGLIVVGSLMVLHRLDLLYFSFRDWWPLLLILFGGGMIVRALHKKRYGETPDGSRAVGDPGDRINAAAVIGGLERRSFSEDFKGGDLTAVMGGLRIDLRHASIRSGPAEFDVFALWGGIEIQVPTDWSVTVEGVPILGGFQDSTHSPSGETSKRLIIRGHAIMGGVEVKN